MVLRDGGLKVAKNVYWKLEGNYLNYFFNVYLRLREGIKKHKPNASGRKYINMRVDINEI